ncbi:MAG: zinc uptake protein ZrgA [Pelagimonas sp.]|uniref:zinc uptake protein ZrgA n=1 Tax=Pelagimonas sp. TaxID=2073170 RepID=UPI003D6C4285
MKTLSILALTTVIAAPVFAETARQLGAHEHGVGQLDIAFDGGQIAMELHAPGADIVGFEYEATSAEDKTAVDTALAALVKPLDLFVLADAAGCTVAKASAELEAEGDHDDHGEEGHDDHGEEAHHDHDEHAEKGHDDHDHDEHGHDDHDDHAEKGHDDHDEHGEDHHDDHADEAGHTEFHAQYLLDCTDPSAVTQITFAYFDTFPNALEVEVQIISDKGATSFEVEKDAPVLDLGGLF